MLLEPIFKKHHRSGISKKKKMASTYAFEIVLVLISLCCAADETTNLPPKIFNVVDYGAKADGNTDDSKVSFEQ